MNEHQSDPEIAGEVPGGVKHHTFTDAIVRVFLDSNLSLILDPAGGGAGAGGTADHAARGGPADRRAAGRRVRELPRPFGGRRSSSSSPRRWRSCSTRSTAWSTSIRCRATGQAIITVRFYVGEDRERSLVKLYKKIDENIDIVPPGVTGWVVKPVEIDDVPIVDADADQRRRRTSTRCAAWPRRWSSGWRPCKDISRAYVVGGQPRTVHVYLDPDRMQALQRRRRWRFSGRLAGRQRHA